MYDMIVEVDGHSSRFNSDKVVYSNIPPALLKRLFSKEVMFVPHLALNKLAEHYTLAESKYPNAEAGNGHTFPNWGKGQLFESFVIDSMYRHLMAYFAGERYDADFGTHHLISVAWGAACLFQFFTHYELYQSFDDRKWVGFYGPKYETIEAENLATVAFSNIPFIQTSQSLAELVEASFHLFLSVLYVAQEDLMKDTTISFKVDAERLAKIRESILFYGEKKISSGKSD